MAVDLGSSNVVVAVGEKLPEGPLAVRCVVSRPVEGVSAGKIENIEQVSRAVQEAVQEVERQMNFRITEAYAGISGEFVRCARHTDHVFVYDPQNGVSRKDVDALSDRMRNVQAPDDELIMERVPQHYMVDDSQKVKNPVGAFGRKLSSTFNFILCHQTPMQRLGMALKRLGIKMLGVVPDALVTPEAVLTPDEKEEGVAVVDLGGGVTDVTVYYGNVVRYIASIPMGASAINRDIRTMGVPEKHVESLKQKYGSAVAELAPEDKLIRVNGRTVREAKDILLRNLATVIEARATDIVEFVQQEIADSGYGSKLAYGIVLTGGSAHLRHIDELFRRVTGSEVRIVRPEAAAIDADSRELVADPAYATVVGILLKGAELGSCAVIEQPAQPRRIEPETGAAAAGEQARAAPPSRRPCPSSATCRTARRRPPPHRGAPRRSPRRSSPTSRATPHPSPSASATGVRFSRRPSTASTRPSRRPRTKRFNDRAAVGAALSAASAAGNQIRTEA